MELLDRDMAMNTAIFGFFAFVWFGWAQEGPPEEKIRWWLGGGSLAGLLLSVFGGFRVGAAESGGALDEGGSMGLFGLVLGLEFGIILLGVIALAIVKRQEYFAPWVCFVVGVHFFPLAPLMENPLLYVLGGLLTVWPFLAVRLARRRELHPSFTTGVGAGLCLLLFGLMSAVGLLIAGV